MTGHLKEKNGSGHNHYAHIYHNNILHFCRKCCIHFVVPLWNSATSIALYCSGKKTCECLRRGIDYSFFIALSTEKNLYSIDIHFLKKRHLFQDFSKEKKASPKPLYRKKMEMLFYMFLILFSSVFQ